VGHKVFILKSTVMSKKRTGYQPPKGKPSGIGKPEESIFSMVKNMEITDRIVNNPEEIISNVHIMHPNRNVDKEEYHRERSKSPHPVEKLENMTGRDHAAVIASELPLPFPRDLFEELAGYTNQQCISVVLPTHSSGVEVNENLANRAFKNILQSLEHQLGDLGVSQDNIDIMLAPGYELLLSGSLWRELSQGLVMFISYGYFRYLRVPFTVPEEIMIQDSFGLAPLLPLLTNQQYFYLLVFDKKHANLYRADAFGIRHAPIKGMPDGIDDVVHFEEKQGKNLWRMGGRGGKGGANFHGVGAGVPDEKTNIAMYLDEVDETLMKEGLADENVPLLLAGVDYMLPIYRQVSTYNHIWDTALPSNYEHENLNTIYTMAMKIIQPYFDEKTKQAVEHYNNQSATALTSSIPADVIPAAHYGKVAQLFVQEGQHIWGRFNEESDHLVIHDSKEPDDECLLNKAVIKTFLTNGEIYFMKKVEMPANSLIAAVMRY
jgi:hypothetical protein